MAERIETLLTAERRLLQDISHELRSPLARLGLAIELARTSADRPLSVERMQRKVDRLSALVGDLIQMTRAEGDPSVRRSDCVRLDELIQDVVQSCGLEADARGCHIRVSGVPGQIVSGDPELLRRAIENVLRNAIRYAPPDTDIELSVERTESVTRISIRDIGSGVLEDVLPRLAHRMPRREPAFSRSRPTARGYGTIRTRLIGNGNAWSVCSWRTSR